MVTVAVVQARMGSSRFPGKVLARLGDLPVIAHVMFRARAIPGVDKVVLATSTLPRDDALAAWAKANGVECIRGSETDVLHRYLLAAQATHADVIVRVTADCPILDPAVSGAVVAARNGADYCTNAVVRTYPDGLDTCVFTRGALEKAHRYAVDPHHREHVVDYFIDNPSQFRTEHVTQAVDYHHLRWTLDYPEDLEFLQAVVQRLGAALWGQGEVLKLLEREPGLARINAPRGKP